MPEAVTEGRGLRSSFTTCVSDGSGQGALHPLPASAALLTVAKTLPQAPLLLLTHRGPQTTGPGARSRLQTGSVDKRMASGARRVLSSYVCLGDLPSTSVLPLPRLQSLDKHLVELG